ncbi:MAG TPA: DUF4236 domain-containing protein [Hyphomicrobiales bacterium]|nr:DUF4236 domain-containing protein [Hyphomicrobiales bacterium]
MGFRFRRSIGLLPGVKLNLSRGGPSVSLGPRGLHYTLGQKGNRFTVGLPGTGMSYTDYEPHGQAAPTAAENAGSPGAGAGRRHTPVLGFLLFLVLLAAYALWSIFLH